MIQFHATRYMRTGSMGYIPSTNVVETFLANSLDEALQIVCTNSCREGIAYTIANNLPIVVSEQVGIIKVITPVASQACVPRTVLDMIRGFYCEILIGSYLTTAREMTDSQPKTSTKKIAVKKDLVKKPAMTKYAKRKLAASK